jgi:hypothetical protein
MMRAAGELPEAVLRQIEMLAGQEGATPGDLIRRIVEDHVARCPGMGDLRAVTCRSGIGLRN